MHPRFKIARKAFSSAVFKDIVLRLTTPNTYSILGRSNQEDWYSHVIAWLLNPQSMHGLDSYPLRQFLALVCIRAEDKRLDKAQSLLPKLKVVDSAEIESSCFMPDPGVPKLNKELSIGNKGKGKKAKKMRFDIAATICLKETGQKGSSRLLFICENKVRSVEAKSGKKTQTELYAQWALASCVANQATDTAKAKENTPHFHLNDDALFYDCANEEGRYVVLVFLSARNDIAKSPMFVSVSYRDLVNEVLVPSLACSGLTENARHILEEFVDELDKNVYATSAVLSNRIIKWLKAERIGVETLLESVLYQKLSSIEKWNTKLLKLNWLLTFGDRKDWAGQIKVGDSEYKLELKDGRKIEQAQTWFACPNRFDKKGKESKIKLVTKKREVLLLRKSECLPLDKVWDDYCEKTGLDSNLMDYANKIYELNQDVLSKIMRHVFKEQKLMSKVSTKRLEILSRSLFKDLRK